MGTPQDGYYAAGSMSISTTAGADIKTFGCEEIAYEVLTATSTPAIKAYGAGPSGTFIPVRYRLIVAAGTESLIDPDTGSGTLAASDRIIVPNNGYDQIRIITTTGTATVNATRNFYGGVAYEIQKLIDGGIVADTTTLNTLVGAVTETAPATDTASSGLNGRLQRIAQRITSLIALLPTALAALGGLKVEKIGVSVHSFIVDGTDELLISAAARRVYGLNATHRDATPISIKLYDKATAASEADTPVWRGQVPANATAALGGGANYTFPEPLVLTNGLSIRAVVGAADADDTALTSGEAEINTFWSA